MLLLTGPVFTFKREYDHCRLKMFHGRFKYLNFNFNGGLGANSGEKKLEIQTGESRGTRSESI